VRIAYFSPMPPERTGVADYSALLLPALRERLDLTVIRRGRKRSPRGTEVSLYHIGNNPDAHAWIVDALRRQPGVVVLHDFVLHHLVAGMTIGRRDGHGYLDAMELEHGVVGRLLAHGVLDKRIPPLWESRPEAFPLASFVLEHATGLIVHSRYVRGLARSAGYDGRIWVVPHPAWPIPHPREMTRPGVATLVGVGEPPVPSGPVFGCFGVINASKRIPELLQAFAIVRKRHPGAILQLVGPTSPGFDLERRLQRFGLADERLFREGWADESRLWALMTGVDVCVNLRYPTMGETSGTVIRALSLGKPLVVSDVGWFSELSDDIALKVTVDEREVETLAAALELLVTREDVREAMGSAASELARREHDLDRVADLYAAVLEEAAGGEAVGDAVLREVSVAAADVGISPDSVEAREIARRLAEVELG
jgi:glycosyltransferase involved in cell wall biosynthesis